MAHQEEFENFHQANPEVLEGLIALTRDYVTAKACRYVSARMIWDGRNALEPHDDFHDQDQVPGVEVCKLCSDLFLVPHVRQGGPMAKKRKAMRVNWVVEVMPDGWAEPVSGPWCWVKLIVRADLDAGGPQPRDP